MATQWPEKRELLGKDFERLDGPEKATGKAKYTYDINRPGMLFGAILRCPYPHAKIKAINTDKAVKVKGFKGLALIAKPDQEMFFVGEEVLAVCADTEEHCNDALRAIEVAYEQLPFTVKEKDALKATPKTARPFGPSDNRSCVQRPSNRSKGNVEAGFQAADAVVEDDYGVSVICHQCLESHGVVAEWNNEKTSLTVWASTQAVAGVAGQLARHFKLAPANVKCITHYMGGGFGSKFQPYPEGLAAAELSRQTGKAVKIMLTREAEIITAGNRPSAYGRVKMGGKKDGTITAYEIEAYGTPGDSRGRTVGPLPYVYDIENTKTSSTVVRVNAGSQRAMRAPGHPQSCFLTDCAIDDLAAKLDIDPLEMRLKNLPKNDPGAAATDPISYNALQETIYRRELDIITKMCDWKKRWHKPGAGKGVMKHGMGMALHTWGGRASPQTNECTILISADGSVTAQTSTQDLGTAQRTVTAIVAAEILGLKPEDVTVLLGESQYGLSSGSGGSTTCPSQAPAALRAVTDAKEKLLKNLAGKLKVKAEDLKLEKGKVIDTSNNKSWDWKQACARLGMDQIKGTGSWTFFESTKEKGVSNSGVGGVQVAEVIVDTETGKVYCKKIYAVQDCGLIINKLACESQVAGGVIMGLNYALFEERIMDAKLGRQMNADMEFYKLGGIEDMPDIEIHMMDMPERGVIGIGEPPTISTHAAIGNAIFNAIGARVTETPFTPERVLEALAKKGGQG